MIPATSDTLRIAEFIRPFLRPLALLPYPRNLPCSPPCPFSTCIETKKKNNRGALSVFKPPILGFARAELIIIAQVGCLLFPTPWTTCLGLRTPQTHCYPFLLLSPDPQRRHPTRQDGQSWIWFTWPNLIPTPHHGGMRATDPSMIRPRPSIRVHDSDRPTDRASASTQCRSASNEKVFPWSPQ